MEFAVTLYIFLPVSLLQAKCCHPVSFLGWLYFLSTGRDHDMVTRVKCHYCSDVGNHSIWGMSDLRMKSNSSNMIQISIPRHQAHSSDNILLGFLIIWRNQTWIGNTFPAEASCETGWSWNLSWISVIPLDQRFRDPLLKIQKRSLSWIWMQAFFLFFPFYIEWLIVFLTRDEMREVCAPGQPHRNWAWVWNWAQPAPAHPPPALRGNKVWGVCGV